MRRDEDITAARIAQAISEERLGRAERRLRRSSENARELLEKAISDTLDRRLAEPERRAAQHAAKLQQDLLDRLERAERHAERRLAELARRLAAEVVGADRPRRPPPAP